MATKNMGTAKDDKIPYLIDDTGANVALGAGTTAAGLGVYLANQQKKADITAAQSQQSRVANLRGPQNSLDPDVTLKQAIKLTDNQKWVNQAMEKARKAAGLSEADWGKLTRSEKLDKVWQSEPQLRARYDAEFQTNVGRAQKSLETATKNTSANVLNQQNRGILGRQVAPTLTKALRDSPLGFFNRGGDVVERVVTGAIKGNSTGRLRGFTAAGAGKIAGGVVKGIPAYLADLGVEAVFRPDEQERIDAVHAKLQKQGFNVPKDEVGKAFATMGDVWRDQGSWFGLGKGRMNQFWAGEGAARLAAGLSTGGASELAAPIRTLQKAGAEGTADDALASAIMADMLRRRFVENKTSRMGPEMAAGLYGDLLTTDKSAVAAMANAFGNPTGLIPKAEPRDAYQAEQEAQYSLEDPKTRFLNTNAAERGGGQFYEDVYQQLPFFADKDGNFVVQGTGIKGTEDEWDDTTGEQTSWYQPEVAPEYVDPKMANLAYLGVLANAGVISQEELYKRTYGSDMPKAVAQNANQGAPATTEQKPVVNAAGRTPVSDMRQTPPPAVRQPTSPQEVVENIQTVGAAQGLSPIASEQQNYMNKRGLMTAEQGDAYIQAGINDPNSKLNQALSRLRAGSIANNAVFANVPQEQLKGRDQGTANAIRLLQAGVITPDQMPNEQSGYITRQNKGTAPRIGHNETDYVGHGDSVGLSGLSGFYDSREADRARSADFRHQLQTQLLSKQRSKGYGKDGWSWEKPAW